MKRKLALCSILIAMLAISFSASAFEDAFEGRYRVGSTTCTVKPIKMAFEVKWAKGKGTEIFFYESQTSEGQWVYSTEEKDGRKNSFVFDNDKFRTGKFIRADGKEFPVRKIK